MFNCEWFESVLIWLFMEAGATTIPIQLCDRTDYEYDSRTGKCCIHLNKEYQQSLFAYVDKEGLLLEHGCSVGLWEITYVTAG